MGCVGGEGRSGQNIPGTWFKGKKIREKKIKYIPLKIIVRVTLTIRKLFFTKSLPNTVSDTMAFQKNL